MRTGDSPAGWTSPGPLSTACLGDSDLATERHFTAHYLWVCRGPLCGGNALIKLERSLRGRIFCKPPATRPGRRSCLPLCLALPGRRHQTPPSTPGGTLGLLPPTLPCLLPGVHAKTCLLRGHDRSLSSSTRQAWQRSLPPTLRALSRVGEDLALQCFSRTGGSSARCPLRPRRWKGPSPIRDPCWGAAASPPPRWALEKCSQGWNCALASPRRGWLPNVLPAAGAVLQERGKMIANMS